MAIKAGNVQTTNTTEQMLPLVQKVFTGFCTSIKGFFLHAILIAVPAIDVSVTHRLLFPTISVSFTMQFCSAVAAAATANSDNCCHIYHFDFLQQRHISLYLAIYRFVAFVQIRCCNWNTHICFCSSSMTHFSFYF